MSCPAANIAWKRTAQEAHLADTCSLIEPGAETLGSGGGVIKGTPTTTTGIACRIESVGDGGDIALVADRLQLVAPMVFYFKTTQAISLLAQLTSGGFTYNVRWVKPVTSKSTLKVVLVDKIT
jgi:hypothetical protein